MEIYYSVNGSYLWVGVGYLWVLQIIIGNFYGILYTSIFSKFPTRGTFTNKKKSKKLILP